MSDTDHSSTPRARKAAGKKQAGLAGLDASPLGLLAGGLAVGAVAGALIPRSLREKELLGPVGRQLGERTRAAVKAASEAGKQELADRGLTRDAAKGQVRSVVDGVVQAASTAGAAAVRTAGTRP